MKLKVTIPSTYKNDIFSSYKCIIDRFNQCIEKYKNVSKIKGLIDDNHISEGTKLKLQTYINSKDYAKDRNYFIIEIQPLLKSVKTIMQQPVEVSFCFCENTNDEEEKKIKEITQKKIKEFWKIAAKYVMAVFLDEVAKDNVKKKTDCDYCGHDKMIYLEYWKVCEKCATVTTIDNYNSSYQDVKRVKIFSKYHYDRKQHFKDTLLQFQGKQNVKISPDVIKSLKSAFAKNKLTIISRSDVIFYLKMLEFKKHIEDAKLIHHIITGSSLPNLKDKEEHIIQDFNTLTKLYDTNFKYNKKYARKNFLHTQYILFQLLKKHKFPCTASNFNLLKTLDRKNFHDDLCKKLFEELGWNFEPIF